jgi:hypothetical protein
VLNRGMATCARVSQRDCLSIAARDPGYWLSIAGCFLLSIVVPF